MAKKKKITKKRKIEKDINIRNGEQYETKKEYHHEIKASEEKEKMIDPKTLYIKNK